MTRSARDTGRVVVQHPSAVLLVAQLVAVLTYPFLDESTTGRALLGVVGTAVVLIAVWAVRRTPALSCCCTRRSTSSSPTR